MLPKKIWIFLVFRQDNHSLALIVLSFFMLIWNLQTNDGPMDHLCNVNLDLESSTKFFLGGPILIGKGEKKNDYVFSKHRPSGPMLSISRNVRLSVCRSVHSSVDESVHF